MTDTMLTVSDKLLTRLRTLTRRPEHDEEETELREAVAELLDAIPAEGVGEKEYAFDVILRGVARVTARDRRQAGQALIQFENVDCVVTYDEVTVTELSLVPEDVRLIAVDGKELNA